MHIAIDDTYGPVDVERSQYVTGMRRTYVGVQFNDAEAEEVRENISGCLAALPELVGISPTEFHFVDMYNRKGLWAAVPQEANLDLFEFFANIYRRYRWSVWVQTVDDRTLSNGELAVNGVVDGIDLTTREGQALILLLLKIRRSLPSYPEKVILRIDEGLGRPNAPFASKIFSAWRDRFNGRYASSAEEPLIQIADFLAFCINRSTHLALKDARTATDIWFLNLVGRMGIDSTDLKAVKLPANFSRKDFDEFHAKDRREKGLE